MLFSERSLTAEAAALSRALGTVDDDLPTRCDDHLARLVVHPVLRWMLGSRLSRGLLRWWLERLAPGLYAWHCLRTGYFDRLVREAVRRGTRQVVILGAGLDTRASRLLQHLPDVTVYEVDQTSNARRKAATLERAGVGGGVSRRLVRSRIGESGTSLSTLLEGAGLCRTAPVFVLCEGLLMYLEAEERDALFGEIASLSPDVTLAFDFVDASTLVAGAGSASLRMRISASAVGETYRSGISPAELPTLLEAAGLALGERLDVDALAAREWGGLRPRHSISACSSVAWAATPAEAPGV